MQRLYIILGIILFVLVGVLLFAFYISLTVSGGILEALIAIFSGEAFQSEALILSITT